MAALRWRGGYELADEAADAMFGVGMAGWACMATAAAGGAIIAAGAKVVWSWAVTSP